MDSKLLKGFYNRNLNEYDYLGRTEEKKSDDKPLNRSISIKKDDSVLKQLKEVEAKLENTMNPLDEPEASIAVDMTVDAKLRPALRKKKTTKKQSTVEIAELVDNRKRPKLPYANSFNEDE